MARLIVFCLCISLLVACNAENQQTLESPIPFLAGTGEVASKNYTIQFPEDHRAHPEFDIEWWYLTSNLTDEKGNDYAFQWTLFRFANQSANSSWDAGQVYMGHASLHSDTQHWFNERFAAGGSGRAGVQTDPLNHFIDNWYWQSESPERFPSTVFADIALPDARAKVALQLTAPAEFVLHGQEGYSIKTADQTHASHYYSQPFIKAEGTLEMDGVRVAVSGTAWYDHEWSSQLINTNTLGWDWVSLHLDSGDKLMAFRMRTEESDYITGTYISKEFEETLLLPEDMSLEVVEQGNHESDYPLRWQIVLPSKQLDITVVASKEDAENKGVFTYYEGPVIVSGTHNGRGFLEMTGY